MKKTISLCIIIAILCVLSSCESDWRYNKEWIVGKNSKQIQARYGKFDGHTEDVCEDGLYKDCIGIYFLQIDTRNWDERLPNEYLYIVFDSDGVARKVYKYVAQGG